MRARGTGRAAVRCAAMVHLRIVVPAGTCEEVLELLEGNPSVVNVVHLPGVARRPAGDLVLCDVAREDASVVLSDLRRLDVDHLGSIMVESVDTQLSDAADAAIAHAPGDPTDAVVWEQVEAQTSEQAQLSEIFLVFIALAGVIAAIGILLDSPILVVGGMVVGPEFGPIAGFCVAAVNRRPRLAARSFAALLVGFPLSIGVALLVVLGLKALGVAPAAFDGSDHALSSTIANPDVYAAVVALSAGVVGMLSLSTAKSGALIGVLISVTTIPAAANVGVAAAYGDGSSFAGSLGQLGLNVACLLLAGAATLEVQRLAYFRRRAAHRRRGPAA